MARYLPELYRANVLDPIGLEIPRFDSISMTRAESSSVPRFYRCPQELGSEAIDGVL